MDFFMLFAHTKHTPILGLASDKYVLSIKIFVLNLCHDDILFNFIQSLLNNYNNNETFHTYTYFTARNKR
jgi:hypothetical protein